jgi:CHAT domain-containing protein
MLLIFSGRLNSKPMQSLLEDSHTALVAFCITEQGSMGFIMSCQGQDLVTAEASTFAQADLVQLFAVRDEEENLVGGWLGAYTRYLRQPNPATRQNWEETMTQTLKMLGQRLLVPLLSGLPADVRHLIFLPSAQLFLFPLHAVPLSDNGADLACDRYQVSYAPSMEVLLAAKARVAQTFVPNLYAVINPEVDPQLVFTQVEGQALANLFVQRQVDTGRVGTKERVITEIPQRSYVHFSCQRRWRLRQRCARPNYGYVD